MNDRNGAGSAVVKYRENHDERLLVHFAAVLQHTHHDRRTSTLKLELMTLKLMVESYENLGRFSEAAAVRMSIDVIANDLAMRQADDNEELMNRSELGAFAKGLKF